MRVLYGLSVLTLLRAIANAFETGDTLSINVVGRVSVRVILVSATDFNATYLTREARKQLASPARFAQVYFFTDRQQWIDSVRLSDLDYDSWRRVYDRMSRQQMKVALAVSIDNDSVLRVRDHQSVQTIPLSGRNPLLHDLGSSRFEILIIALTKQVFRVQVFVLSSQPLRLESAELLYQHLRRITSAPDLYVVIRPDWCFLYQDAFPMYYWFSADPPPPFSEQDTAPQITCYEFGQKPLCLGARLTGQ